MNLAAHFQNQMFMKGLTGLGTGVLYRSIEQSFRTQNNCFANLTSLTELMLMNQISKVLKERLSHANMARVAREIGVTKSALHDWVNGNRLPSLKHINELKRLADFLSIGLEDLLLGESENQIIASVHFEDRGCQYKLKIERIG